MNNFITTQNAALPARYRERIEVNALPLTEDNNREALNFLSLRPINSVILAGWIHDHGIVSPNHRGTLYGCRNAKGDLTGVAMIGTNLLFEASTEEAIKSFARCARDCTAIRMVFAEEEKLNTFWRHYRGEDPKPRASRHRLITCSETASDVETIDEMRIATPADLEQIVAAHAEMVFAETGVDPLVTDADGFKMRCSQRVDRGWVWVWFKDGEMIFKTDILSVTPKAIYIEGLWVNPKHRGNGYSTRCLASMNRQLLSGSNTICGFLDADHIFSNSLYRRAGFTPVDEYGKIIL